MTIVYTTIFGGSDSLKPAPAGADRAVCFVDYAARHTNAMGWEIQTMPHAAAYLPNPRRRAWWMRCIPHILFPRKADYDRVVWIDASFTLTDLPRLLRDAGNAPIAALRHHERDSPYWEAERLVKIGQSRAEDVQPQLAAYRKAGFDPGHLSISCVIVRDRSAAVQGFNETWDAEIRRWPGDNTQVSLDYSAWKNGLTITALQGTRLANPYATHDGDDHRKRRRPYEVPTA